MKEAKYSVATIYVLQKRSVSADIWLGVHVGVTELRYAWETKAWSSPEELCSS